MAEKINTRELVVDILLSVTRDGEMSHIVIKNVLDKYGYLPRRDRAFIRKCASGTLERTIELDYIINSFSKTPVKKMKPVIRCIMRSSVYQMLYMDSIPDSAICNEAVKLAVKRGFSGLKGFVNGVLRNIARNKSDISYPAIADGDMTEYLSVRYSSPEWLTKKLISQYGEKRAESILEAYLESSTVTVRVDTDRISVDEMISRFKDNDIYAVKDERVPYALHISGFDRLDAIPEFEEGLLYVQDVASMMVGKTALEDAGFVSAADVPEGFMVLDVCAAPGGKSIHMAQLLHGAGCVISRDISDYKVGLIEDNIDRTGVTNMSAQVFDAAVFDPSMEGKADIVIADLPCSGLGVIGSKCDIKYNASQEKIEDLAALQKKILTVVCRYVKPGGLLMFSTCTIADEENTQNTKWFLKEHPEFILEKEIALLPDEDCDGFYIARFKLAK